MSFLIAMFALAVALYTFVGHPLVLYLISRFSPKTWNVSDDLPSVLIFVAAHNEERDIRDKLDNLLALKYDGEMSILIADDASTDRTADIVKEYACEKLDLKTFSENVGKTAMQNNVIPDCRADIVIMSDATSMWPTDTVEKIARNFADDDVGCVTVDVNFIREVGGSVQKGQGALWKYERFLRERGALAGTGIVASGTCYAIRSRLYRQLPPEIAEDLGTPLGIAQQGFRVVFDRSVRVSEVSKNSHDDELSMRVRIALQNITALVYFRNLFSPKFGFVAFQFFGLKFLRASCWVALVALPVACFIGRDHDVLEFLLWTQLLFYASAGIGFLFAQVGRKAGILDFPYYFTLLNFSYAIGLLRYVRGHRGATWKTKR